MATTGNINYNWTIECIPPGGFGSTVTFESGGEHKTRPSSWKLDQREDVAATSLEIRFPDATQFFNVWNEYNPLTVGTEVVLKVDGITRFTGWVFDFKPRYSAKDRSVVVVCRDRMGMTKDACVDIDIRRDTFREKINLIRKNPSSSIFLAVENVTPLETGLISAFADNGDGTTRVTSAAHGLSDNEIVKITGTTNYDGVYSIQYNDPNTYDIALAFVADDATGTWVRVGWIRPWAEEYIVPAWLGDPTTPGSGAQRIILSEYTALYEVGGIAFNQSTVRVLGEIDDDEQSLDDIEDDVWVDAVYYDTDDDSTMISNLMRLVFEEPEANGGLAWTEGVEYAVTDETTGDILSGMRWNTNEGDGDAVSFISNLYDDPRIGLAPSYWMRDFNGNGQVTLKLVTQDNDNAIDVDVILDAQLPNPFSSIYSRAVLVNNDSTRDNLMRDATVTDIFPTGDFPEGDVEGVTETSDYPGSSAVGPENIQDGTSKTTWGYFAIGGKGAYALDMDLPQDKALCEIDFGEVKEIDAIYLASLFTFEGGDESQPLLHDETTGKNAVNGLYLDSVTGGIHEPMRITIEYSTDTDATPDSDSWYTVNSDLYLREVDITDSKEWIQVENINREARYLRVIVNNPAFAKVGESNWSNKAERALMWFLSEMIVLGRGRVTDSDGNLPFVQFTDNAGDPNRCLYNINDEYVDMYRPTLLKYLEACGLKYKTLIIEADDVWDFAVKQDADPDEVGFGYKYLVSRLDAASKENEWVVTIAPRPDVRIGSTVYSSKLDPDKYFLVLGSSLQLVSGRMVHTLTLTDVESVDGGSPSGYC
jgi:hypothetical protein